MATYTAPIFNPAVTTDELWRNILAVLGDTGTPTDMHAILKNLASSLSGSFQAGTSDVAPTGASQATVGRPFVGVETTAISTGVRYMAAIWLNAGTTVNNFNFLPGTTGDAGPTDQWMALYTSARVCVAVSADATTTAITASTAVAYAVAHTTAGVATSYVVPTSGVYYVGLMIATSNAPTLVTATGISHVNALPPIATGTSGTGLTTPDSATTPTTAGTITATAATPYFWLT